MLARINVTRALSDRRPNFITHKMQLFFRLTLIVLLMLEAYFQKLKVVNLRGVVDVGLGVADSVMFRRGPNESEALKVDVNAPKVELGRSKSSTRALTIRYSRVCQTWWTVGRTTVSL